jgi:phosphoglucosamine mutase
MTRKYFGTDGIRGRVGEYPITADFVMKLGWAAGRVFARRAEGTRKLILIGKDTRISGYMFESAMEAGLIAAGVDVGLLGPMPTPAIAYLARTFNAQAGIVISASHNPFDDNGIKFFGSEGVKLPDDVELEIEAELDNVMTTAESAVLGKAQRIADAAGRYIEFCKSTFPVGKNLRKLKIVVDCANGATYHIAPNVFRELGATVIEIGVEPDGFNINRNCGSTHPEQLQKTVREQQADLGIALDGDGDRVLFVDHHGDVLDGDELLFVIAHDRHSRGKLNGGVVGTLMSNYGFEIALKNLAIPFVRAKVGDRYVIEAMAEKNWQLGGESSGHIICNDLTSTGDGIVSALQVLRAMLMAGRSLADLKQGMSKYPQIMINVKASNTAKLKNNSTIERAVAEAEKMLGDFGRVLLRPSGTEPVVRVMVEGRDESVVRPLVVKLAEVVAAELG